MEKFENRIWEERLAECLVALVKAQKPFLHQYWEAHGFPATVTYNGRDETPFPVDDHFMIYEDATHSFRFGTNEYFAPLKAALDPVRGVLRDHPVLAQALGRQIQVNDVQVGILNGSSLTSLNALIVGQMALNPAASLQGFLQSASKLNVLLLSSMSQAKPGDADDLNVGMDAALFFGLRIPQEIDLGEGYALVPLEHISEYVDRSWLQEVAPEHVRRRRIEGIFAIVHRFSWKPSVRNRHSMVEGAYKAPPPLFHRWTEEYSNLLAVTLGMRTSRIMTLEGCISRTASELLGQHHGPNSPQKGRSISHLFDPFTEFTDADVSQLERAKDLFSRRATTAYADLAPAIYRLAEAHGRDGRFSAHDRILDLAIVFERMFRPPRNEPISKFLQNGTAELLGESEEEKELIKAEVKHLYDVRSAIIHGPTDSRKTKLLSEVEKAWIAGAALARDALLQKLE